MTVKKKCRDNIIGGISKFINVNKKKDVKKEEFIKKYSKDYYKIRKKFKIEYNKIDFTKRVLIPENNTERISPKKLRIITEAGKKFRRFGEGSYMSLLVRTPMSFPVKGRKRLNSSFDCGNKNYNIIFYDNNNTEECKKENNRLFGVERKYRNKVINAESKVPSVKLGRKHFFEKIKKTKIF